MFCCSSKKKKMDKPKNQSANPQGPRNDAIQGQEQNPVVAGRADYSSSIGNNIRPSVMSDSPSVQKHQNTSTKISYINNQLSNLQDLSVLSDQSRVSKSTDQEQPQSFVSYIQQMKQQKPAEGLMTEQRFIEKNIKQSANCNYILDINWAIQYTNYLQGSVDHQPPITNNVLLVQPSTDYNQQVLVKSLNGNGQIKKGMRAQNDFVLLNKQTWMFIKEMYGGGPEIYLQEQPIPINESSTCLEQQLPHSVHSNNNQHYNSQSLDMQFTYPQPQEAQSEKGGKVNYPQSVNYSSNERYISLKKMQILDLKPNGLANTLFYCYMNAALQCLLSLGQLSYYYSQKEKVIVNSKRQKFSVSYHELVNYVLKHSDQRQPVIQHTKLQKLVEVQFNRYEQHDAHEFLLFLLSKLSEESSDAIESPSKIKSFNNPKDALSHYCKSHTHIVDQLFMGQITTSIECGSCKHISQQYEPFFDVAVPIEPNSKNIADCLKLYFKDEKLDDEWYCEHCKSKVKKSKRRARITYNPNILIVQLKRFHVYPEREKIKTPIEIYSSIDLGNYQQDKYQQDKRVLVPYSLKAVIVHKGTVESGHYVAMTRKSSKWYHYDDEEVTPLQQSDIEEIDQAYVLFYEKQ